MSATADQIDALLPQTQCQRCGYDGCLPYAEAVAKDGELINRCPPGGAVTIEQLSRLTGQPPLPLAEDCVEEPPRRVAYIREDECIGCTKCIQVCPVDAIVGAAKLMHTVIAAECTGCDLCIPACPVDCIDMPAAAEDEGQPAWPPLTNLDEERAEIARQRYHARNRRIEQQQARRAAERARRKAARTSVAPGDNSSKAGQENQKPGSDSDARKQAIAAALARARAKRAR